MTTITVNGDVQELHPGETLAGMLDRLGIGAGPVLVERNGERVPPDELASLELEPGDVIEVTSAGD